MEPSSPRWTMRPASTPDVSGGGGLQPGRQARPGGRELRCEHGERALGQWRWNLRHQDRLRDGQYADLGGGGGLQRDGKPDLAVANTVRTVSVLLGSGDGTFATKADYVAGLGPTSVAVGDFNLDGRPDLAVANYTSNTVSVLLGSCGTAACPSGQALCGTSCVDLQNDANNCGGCGLACSVGCSAGECLVTVASGGLCRRCLRNLAIGEVERPHLEKTTPTSRFPARAAVDLPPRCATPCLKR